MFMGLLACSKGGGNPPEETPLSPNRLVVTDLEYSNVGTSYELDLALKLKILKKYRLRGAIAYRDPDLKTYRDELNGDYYLSTTLIPFENGSANSDYYHSGNRQQVHIEEGVLNATVEFKFEFSELPLLVSPSQLLVQFEPVAREMPRGISLTTRFDNFSSSGRLPMEKLPGTAEQIIDAYLAGHSAPSANPQNKSPRQLFAESLRLRPFGFEGLKGIGVSEREFDVAVDALLKNGNVSREVAIKFCTWIYDYPSADWRGCTVKPEQMISLFGSRHVNKILSNPIIQSVDSYFVQLSDFQFTESTSSEEQLTGTRDTTFLFNLTSLAGKIEAKLGFNFFGSGGEASTSLLNETGIRVGHEWFKVRQHVDRQTKEGVRRSYSKNRNLQVQEWHFKFGADVDRCLAIAGKAKGHEGVLICKQEPNAKLTERWFFMNQSAFNFGAPMPLNNNASERLLSAAIRGQSNFQEMMKVFSSDFEMVFQKTERGTGPLVDGSFPGLIAN